MKTHHFLIELLYSTNIYALDVIYVYFSYMIEIL